MNRSEITKFLTNVLIKDKLTDRKYYAREITLDYGTDHAKRIDVMQFVPQGVFHVSDIEKGIFICYEIKSCKEDIYSGNGLNFFGEENYIVTTAATYHKLLNDGDLYDGILQKYVKEHHPESNSDFGILVAVPDTVDCRKINDVKEEIHNPSQIDGNVQNWKLYKGWSTGGREPKRDRSTVELLFCMLRAKHNYTNNMGL